MCTSDTGQHVGEGVLYILTVNLNTREHSNYDEYLYDKEQKYFITYLDIKL